MNILQRLWVNTQLLFRDYATLKLFRLEDYGKPKYGMESQGMDVVDDRYIIQASDNTGKNASVVVIDMIDKKIVYETMLGFHSHVNNVNATDDMLYISECKGKQRCHGYISQIPIFYREPAFILSYRGVHYDNCKNAFDWFVDGKFIYTFGMADGYGTIEVLKFKKPYAVGNKTLSDKDILHSFTLTDCHVYQGTKVIDGKLYALFGLGTKDCPTYIKIIDIEKGVVERSIRIDGLGELEALGKYEDGIIVVNCAYNPTYTFVKLKNI